MSWAARRRLVILVILGLIVIAFSSFVFSLLFYRAPSCTDHIQDQGEAGIDCGGPCPYLCTAQEQPPTVLFTQALSDGSGRTDVIASVENKNADAAAQNIPFTIMLYGAGEALLKEVPGTLDLPPGATVPVYVPGVFYGEPVTSAFLDIASSSPRWFAMMTDPRVIPSVTKTSIGGSPSAPRVEAVFMNPSVADLTNVRAIVFVHGVSGNIIAASQTIVPVIPSQGSATGIFTWNSPFSETPVSVEVIPVIPLPSPS